MQCVHSLQPVLTISKRLLNKTTSNIFRADLFTCIVLQRDLLMEENSNWVLEVEEALLDEAPPERIRVLLAGASSL